MKTSSLISVSCLLASTAFASSAAGATFWTGADVSDDNWNTVGNWSNGLPLSNGTNNATIDLAGAVVNLNAPGFSRNTLVSGTGGAAPVLNIAANLTNPFSAINVGSDATGSNFSGVVNHTAGTVNIGGGSGSRRLLIAAAANPTSTGTGNTGTYNFGGDALNAPSLIVNDFVGIAARSGETGFFNLSGSGSVQIANQLTLGQFNGSGNMSVTGGLLDINIGGDFSIAPAGAGSSSLSVTITDTGLSTINVGGDVVLDFAGTTPGSAAFNLNVDGSFVPVAGTKFVVIDADGSFTGLGGFAGIADGDVITAGGVDFTANYDTSGSGTQFTLTVIPEPGSLGLVMLGGLAVGFRRRR